MRNAQRLWIAAIITGSVLVGASTVQAQHAKVLPADTEMAITFNLKQIFGSDVVKANKPAMEFAQGKLNEALEDQGIAKYLKKANFDLFRDLTSVTVAVPGERSPEEAFIVLEGHFDAEKIEAAVIDASKETDAKVKIIKIGTSKAFEVSPKGEKPMYIGILNKKTIIASATKTDFTEAVERLSSEKAVTFKSETFKSLMETVNSKQSISFVATSKILAKLGENAPNAGNKDVKMAMAALQQVSGFSAAITIQKNIDFLIGVNTKDAETATKFSTMANLGMVLGKAKLAEMAKQNPNLAPAVEVVDTLRVDAKGANIVVNGQVTLENLEKVLKSLPIPQ